MTEDKLFLLVNGLNGFDLLMIAVFCVSIWSLWEGIKAHSLEKHQRDLMDKPKDVQTVEKIRENLHKRDAA